MRHQLSDIEKKPDINSSDSSFSISYVEPKNGARRGRPKSDRDQMLHAARSTVDKMTRKKKMGNYYAAKYRDRQRSAAISNRPSTRTREAQFQQTVSRIFEELKALLKEHKCCFNSQ